MEVVVSLSQGRTAAAQCRLFTHKSVPVIFEPPCTCIHTYVHTHIHTYVVRTYIHTYILVSCLIFTHLQGNIIFSTYALVSENEGKMQIILQANTEDRLLLNMRTLGLFFTYLTLQCLFLCFVCVCV